jgi:hypothetical protein
MASAGGLLNTAVTSTYSAGRHAVRIRYIAVRMKALRLIGVEACQDSGEEVS